MFVECVYPTMSTGPYQLSICLQNKSVALTVFNGFLYYNRHYTVAIYSMWLEKKSGTITTLLGP